MEIWRNKSCIHCKPNRSLLTIGSCQTNQEQALIGTQALLSGESVYEVPEYQIARIMACGGCEYCEVEIPVEKVKELLREEFEEVAERLENFDWYKYDEDVVEVRRKQRNRRIVEKRRAARG